MPAKGTKVKGGQSRTLKDAYKHFKDTAVNSEISYSVYRAISERFNLMLQDALSNGKFMVLPYLGKFRVQKFPNHPSKAIPDWKRYNETGEYTRLYDPFRVRIDWCRYKHIPAAMDRYGFFAVRKFNRRVAALYKSKQMDYPVQDIPRKRWFTNSPQSKK